MNVAGNKEIEAAVAVVVAPGCAGRPVAERDAGLFGDIGKGAVVIVVVEAILAEVGDDRCRAIRRCRSRRRRRRIPSDRW